MSSSSAATPPKAQPSQAGTACAAGGTLALLVTVILLCVVAAKKGGSAMRAVTLVFGLVSAGLIIAAEVLLMPTFRAASNTAASAPSPGYGHRPPALLPTGAASGRSVTWDPAVRVRQFHATDPPSRVAPAAGDDAAAFHAADQAADTQVQVPAEPALPSWVPEGAAAAGAAADAPPPSPYWAGLPTPEALREERERFTHRPDMPALDRQRREVGLREAAASLKPPRDGYMVPVGPVPAAA